MPSEQTLQVNIIIRFVEWTRKLISYGWLRILESLVAKSAFVLL